MATRSFIGIQNPDGSVRGVYCHFDGYLEGVGSVLKSHYVDHQKVNSLVDLGGLSSLGREIGEKHDFDSPRYADYSGCTAYHRDRGEVLDISVYPSRFSVSPEDGVYEFIYVYTTEGWIYRTDEDETFLPVP
jgi:hypothetical protein